MLKTDRPTVESMVFKDDISYFEYLEWKRERRYRLNRDDIEFLYRIVRESFGNSK